MISDCATSRFVNSLYCIFKKKNLLDVQQEEEEGRMQI